MKKLKERLVELLNIYAPSGKEQPVRDYLKPILEETMDNVFIDEYGNLLAEKKVGIKQGAVVMLSAHMDTVRGVKPDKIVEENDGVFFAKLPDGKRGVLGADDRAGIAIILHALENIPVSFEGTIKIAFTREEEVGCIGAEMIDPDFYSDVDLVIVVDRRGNRDIVVGSEMPFCSNMVGAFMEDVSNIADMNWKCVRGGMSDAWTFSTYGTNSINLSAGYYNEHTSKEYVSINDMKDTVKFIAQALALINQFYYFFGKVPLNNQWIKNEFESAIEIYDFEV